MKTRTILTLLGTLLVIFLVLFIFKLRLTNYRTHQVSEREKQLIVQSFLERDRLQFELQESIPSIRLHLDNYLDAVGQRAIILFLPEKLCWDCFVDHLKNVCSTSALSGIDIIILCSEKHFRNSTVLANSFQNISVFLGFDHPIIEKIEDTILFMLFDPVDNIIIPYIEHPSYRFIEEFIAER